MSADHEAELDWTRRQLDEVAAETLRLSRRTQQAQRELELRRRGFTLLAGLGRTLGAHVELRPALAAVLHAIEAGMQVDRVVALEARDDAWVPFAWTGFRGPDASAIAEALVRLPGFVREEGLLVTRETEAEDWVQAARAAFGVPVFVAAPVADGQVLLVAGREAELAGFHLRLGRADVDTLAAAGGLVAAAVQNTQVAALGQLKRFLPPAVAAEVMSGRIQGGHGHERREITLLAADMVGFTRLADRIDPDELADVLNGYLTEMTSLAHAHGGTVGSLAGDGVLVIFGAPEACEPEEHAWLAAQAAFAMRARLAAVADDAEAPVSIRIGLNTGSCAVGVFGTGAQATYTAIGLPVNLAARLESASAPGMILASERTAALLGERVNAVPRGELTLKGFRDPVPALIIEPPAG